MASSTTLQPSNGCESQDSMAMGILALVLLFFLILGMAGSVDVYTLRAQFDKRRGILCGLGCQFLLMPFIGAMVVKLAEPEQHVGLTLMVLVSSSGGAYSNWWCSVFNADLALSIAMTATSTAICALMLPLNIMLYSFFLFDEGIDLPWMEMVRSIGAVLLGIVLGVTTTTYRPDWRRRMNLLGNMCGIGLIVLTGVGSMLKKKPKATEEAGTPPWKKDSDFYIVVASPFVVAFLLSLLISSLPCLKLERPERVAITIEVCYQNVGIASAVALSAFCDNPRILSDAVAVPLIYGMLEAVFLAGFCVFAWKLGWTYAPSDLKLRSAIVGDFQPESPASRISPASSKQDSHGTEKTVKFFENEADTGVGTMETKQPDGWPAEEIMDNFAIGKTVIDDEQLRSAALQMDEPSHGSAVSKRLYCNRYSSPAPIAGELHSERSVDTLDDQVQTKIEGISGDDGSVPQCSGKTSFCSFLCSM